MGHEITEDWTVVTQESPQQAIKDLHGVMHADALFFLADRDFMFRGAWVEFGAAAALGKPIFVLKSQDVDLKNIFLLLPNVMILPAWDDEALERACKTLT
jgi:nucleoside 2-deoxyribosyltransferase